MSDAVVDASVAVKWFVEELDGDKADELASGRHRLSAPAIIITEVANALCRKSTAGLMTSEQARNHWRTLSDYFDDILPVDDMIEPALRMACELRHPVYDVIYLETARRLDAQLITADRRFIAKLAGTGLARHVTLLSDWQPA